MEKLEDRNKGAISKNKRKAKPSHPDYTGDVNIDGVEYWISGWIQDGVNGKFLSLSFRPKQPTQPMTGDESWKSF